MSEITIFRGDTVDLDLAVTTGSDKVAADLTDSTLYFTVKTDNSVSTANATIKKQSPEASGITITDAANGLATINIPTGDSFYLKTGPYIYGIQLKDSYNSIYTVMTGIFNVKADVTRRTW